MLVIRIDEFQAKTLDSKCEIQTWEDLRSMLA